VLDALRVHAAQYKTRPSQAEHVAERAGPARASQGRQPASGELQGPRGWNWNCRAHSGTAGGGGGGRNVLIAVLESLAPSYLELQGIDPPD
jgi:hypothetical protein